MTNSKKRTCRHNYSGTKNDRWFVSYWSDVMTKPDDPSSIDRSHAFAKKMIETPKVVFTKTQKSQWANTYIATGHLIDEITKLKSQDGKDIIVYGGASFDSSLIRAGLIDEFHLFIIPVTIGNGMTIFKDLNEIQDAMANDLYTSANTTITNFHMSNIHDGVNYLGSVSSGQRTNTFLGEGVNTKLALSK